MIKSKLCEWLGTAVISFFRRRHCSIKLTNAFKSLIYLNLFIYFPVTMCKLSLYWHTVAQNTTLTGTGPGPSTVGQYCCSFPGRPAAVHISGGGERQDLQSAAAINDNVDELVLFGLLQHSSPHDPTLQSQRPSTVRERVMMTTWHWLWLLNWRVFRSSLNKQSSHKYPFHYDCHSNQRPPLRWPGEGLSCFRSKRRRRTWGYLTGYRRCGGRQDG